MFILFPYKGTFLMLWYTKEKKIVESTYQFFHLISMQEAVGGANEQ